MLPSLATVKKQLNRVKAKKTLKTPLSKEEAERILREVAFSKTSQTLSKWDPVVVQNRRAEQLVFPMEKELSAVALMEHVFSGWKARTPLEQDVFNLLHKNKQPVTDPLLTPVEKASLKAMSLEEAKIRRAELQKARVLQSYYEARARREKKIKSKKHHKVVKKGKAKKALKEVEHLWKVNPSAALEELGRAEMARMMERMSLKHQGSGKWARSKSVMAKYDLEARQAMQEQLAKNKELTQKLQVMPQSEEEEINSEEGESAILGKTGDLEMRADGLNPWMLGSCSPVTVVHTVPKQLPELEACTISEGKGAERPVAREDMLLKQFEKEGSLRKRFKPNHDIEAKDSNSQEVLTEWKVFQKLNKQNHWTRKPTVSSMGSLLQAQGGDTALEKEEHVLLQSLERVQTVEEVELDTDECFQSKELAGEPVERDPHNQLGVSKGKKKKEPMIDLQVLLTTVSPSVSSLAVPTIEELEDEVERDHRQIIKEAFAGDDVIREFLKEKREAVEANKPKDLDLILPGWGEWGGVGLKPSTKKRRHFLIKAPESAPRKDKNLPHVIFSEKVNIHAAAHQVRVLPHPFTHHQQFERTIQNPIGSTWNTQRTFQKLTIPNIDTKPGHVIKPIKAANVGYRSSSRSDLSVLQSNPKRRPKRQQKQQREKSCAD